jgi:hypothetical protein
MRNWERSSTDPGWYVSCNKTRDGRRLHIETGPFETKVEAVRFAANAFADRGGGLVWERKADGSIEGERGI